MRLGSADEPFRWYISHPAKWGPLTFQSLRLPSEVRMNAPLRVPTSTRTVLMNFPHASESIIRCENLQNSVDSAQDQSSIDWYNEAQKSRTTSGPLSEVHMRCVSKMPVRFSDGSARQDVPRPPSQPYIPIDPASLVRRVTTDTPNPQPCDSKKSSVKPDVAFCSGVSWSVVISSTEGLERMRTLPSLPLLSIIWLKVKKSSAVETSPPAPDGK